jgi:hypothetical protein
MPQPELAHWRQTKPFVVVANPLDARNGCGCEGSVEARRLRVGSVRCFIQPLRRVRFSRRRRMHPTLGGASSRITRRGGGELAPLCPELAHWNQTEHVLVLVVVDPLGVCNGRSGCEGTVGARRFLRALRVGRVRCFAQLLLLRVFRFSRRRRHWRHRTLVVVHVILAVVVVVAVDAFGGGASGGRICRRSQPDSADGN